MVTLLSITGYNAVSLWLGWLKFRLFPFTNQTAKAVGLTVAAYLVAGLIPVSGYALFDLALHSGFFALIFGVLVLLFRVSEDLNGLEKIVCGKLGK